MLSYSVSFLKKMENLGIFTGAEAATGNECSVETTVLKISQYSQKNASVGVIFLIKLLNAAAFSTADQRDSNIGVFSVNIVIFKNTYYENICEELFLKTLTASILALLINADYLLTGYELIGKKLIHVK